MIEYNIMVNGAKKTWDMEIRANVSNDLALFAHINTYA